MSALGQTSPHAVVEAGVVVGFADTPVLAPQAADALPTLRVPGTSLHRLPKKVDARGALSFAEHPAHVPFVPKRFFAIYDVRENEVRGEHAHRELHQFLVCLKGSVSVVLDNGHLRQEVLLNTPEIGLHIRPLVWGTQYRWSADAMLLVLASDVYLEADYLRRYADFMHLVQSRPNHDPETTP